MTVLVNATLIDNNEGSPDLVEGTVVDIMERKSNEEELRQSWQFLLSTLDALSAHVAILDEDLG